MRVIYTAEDTGTVPPNATLSFSVACAMPFTSATTSSFLGAPDESGTHFRTSQGEVPGFGRDTGTKGILATQARGRARHRGLGGVLDLASKL